MTAAPPFPPSRPRRATSSATTPRSSTLGELDDQTTNGAHPELATEAAIESDPDSPVLRASEMAFADDLTNVFGDEAGQTTDGETAGSPDADRADDSRPPAGAVAASGVPFLASARPTSEEIPFTGVTAFRGDGQGYGWLSRVRVALETSWFRSRRTLSTLGAVAGVLGIAGIALYFLANAIVSNSVSSPEGVPHTPTTATSSPNYVATEAPYVTDPPQTHTTTTTTTAPPRRRTTEAPTTTTGASVLPPTSEPTTTDPAGPSITAPSTTDVLPTTTLPFTTLTLPPPTFETTTTKRTTTTRGTTTTRRTTTTVASSTTVDVTTTAPTTEPPTTADTEPPVDTGPPTILSLDVVSLQKRRASINYTADQCVATRFTLSGSDGSTQQGSSPGYDPAVSCDTGWNLNFRNATGLNPGTSYVLTVWIKALNNRNTSAQLSFTTPV